MLVLITECASAGWMFGCHINFIPLVVVLSCTLSPVLLEIGMYISC